MLAAMLFIAALAALALAMTPGDEDQPQDDQSQAQSGGDGQAAGQGQQPGTGAQSTAGGADAGRTLTQAEVDRIVAERLARERRAGEQTKSQLQAEVDRLKQEAEERRQADLTEDQRKEEERQAALRRAEEAESREQAAAARVLRAEAIAADADFVRLPQRYKEAVTGDTAEAIAASIAALKAEYQSDNADKLDVAGLEAARDMTPEDRLAKYGDVAGAKLNEFFKQQPQSVGTPSNQPGQPGVGGQSTYAEKRAEATKLPPGPQREGALLEAWAAKQ